MSIATPVLARCMLAAAFSACIGSAAAFQQQGDAGGLEWLRKSQSTAPPAVFGSADVERDVQRADMDRIGSLPVSCHGRRHPGVLYHVRRLPIDGATLAAPTALNNAGLAVGYRETGGVVKPTLWAGLAAYDLGTPAGLGGRALGIGDSGVVVGLVGIPDPGYGFAAALWYKGVRYMLRSPDPANPYPYTAAVAINRRGTIVGNHHTLATDDDRPVVWRGGVPRFLPALVGIAFAHAINDAGYVVGSSDYPGGILRQRAVFWTPEGRIRELAMPGGLESRAYDINNKGKIVGVVDPSLAEVFQPALWYRGRVTVLPTASRVGGMARAINERDQIVGFQGAGLATTYRAATWFGTTLYQLDTLLDDGSRGLVINEAQDINDRGQIIATSILPSGVNQPLLLTPRPCYRR